MSEDVIRAVIGVGDRVTFPISKTLTGVGVVESIEDDGTAVIVQSRRRYRRPVKDLIRSC